MTQAQPIPANMQGILWSTDIHKLDTERDKTYIVHQTLAYGTLDDYRWLFDLYGKHEVTRIFSENAYRDYSKQRFNFVTQYLLDIPVRSLQRTQYVRATSEHPRRKQS